MREERGWEGGECGEQDDVVVKYMREERRGAMQERRRLNQIVWRVKKRRAFS